MISLGTLFWLMIVLFGLIGSLRGWTKEVIALSGLVLSLFALNFMGAILVGFVSSGTAEGVLGGGSVERRQFWVLTLIHLIIAFFSYQGPAFAGARVRDRLRVRDNIQDKILGGLVGSINGYLLVGALWAFLEYRIISQGQWLRLDPGLPYVFNESVIIRPAIDTGAYTLMANLPIPLLAPYLPILVVVVFLFVIVVMI